MKYISYAVMASSEPYSTWYIQWRSLFLAVVVHFYYCTVWQYCTSTWYLVL